MPSKIKRSSRRLKLSKKNCKIQNIPATVASSEYAPGQFEINLHHTSDVLKAADDAALLSRVIK